MDPITHGITGALIGKGFFSKRHARVAIFAATLGAIFPDVDIVVLDLSHDLLAIQRYHRGFTHSFLGLPIFAALLAWLTRIAAKWFRKPQPADTEFDSPSFGALFLIYAAGIASHILLDATTSFGTRLWNPFSRDRAAWDFLFIIDFTFTALVLLPQVTAWIHKDRHRVLIRAASMWIVFSILTFGFWWLARALDFAFSPTVVGMWSLIFATLFFLPARNGWGVRFGRARWCRAGFFAACAYILACGFAHHAVMTRVRAFASSHNLAVEKFGALPLPPSLLDWNGLIETADGVYQSDFSLLASAAPEFLFFANSSPNRYTREAARLEAVRTYLWYARFPVINFTKMDGVNVVEYVDLRYYTGVGHPMPFAFCVYFDSQGKIIGTPGRIQWSPQVTPTKEKDAE